MSRPLVGVVGVGDGDGAFTQGHAVKKIVLHGPEGRVIPVVQRHGAVEEQVVVEIQRERVVGVLLVEGKAGALHQVVRERDRHPRSVGGIDILIHPAQLGVRHAQGGEPGTVELNQVPFGVQISQQ